MCTSITGSPTARAASCPGTCGDRGEIDVRGARRGGRGGREAVSEIGRGHQRADGKAQGGAARGAQREEPDERRRLQVERRDSSIFAAGWGRAPEAAPVA